MKIKENKDEISEKARRRKARVDRYRYLTALDEDVEITEDTIDPQAFNRTCVEFYCDPSMLRAELLGKDVE